MIFFTRRLTHMNTTYFPSAELVNAGMLKVYNNMGLGLVVTALVSFLVSSSPALMSVLFGTPLKWVVIFAPLVLSLVMSFGMALDKISTNTGRILFYVFSVLMGLSLSTIFVIYTSGSIFGAFVSASGIFFAMSIYGYFTKRSLESLGQFLFIGLIGIIIASVVNIFLENSTMGLVINVLAVLIFTGLTAYDTQRIRDQIRFGSDIERTSVMGAFALYLDFINIFINLLQLFGGRKD